MPSEMFARYGRLYAALAPLCISLSLLSPFDIIIVGDRTTYFGSLWNMASTPAGDPARAAMVLLVIMVGGLLAAALWPTVPALPAVNGVAAAVVAILLWTRPATGDPTPGLSTAGTVQLALTAAIVATSATHLVHLRRHRRQTRQRPTDTVAAETNRDQGAAQARVS